MGLDCTSRRVMKLQLNLKVTWRIMSSHEICLNSVDYRKEASGISERNGKKKHSENDKSAGY